MKNIIFFSFCFCALVGVAGPAICAYNIESVLQAIEQGSDVSRMRVAYSDVERLREYLNEKDTAVLLSASRWPRTQKDVDKCLLEMEKLGKVFHLIENSDLKYEFADEYASRQNSSFYQNLMKIAVKKSSNPNVSKPSRLAKPNPYAPKGICIYCGARLLGKQRICNRCKTLH